MQHPWAYPGRKELAGRLSARHEGGGLRAIEGFPEHRHPKEKTLSLIFIEDADGAEGFGLGALTVWPWLYHISMFSSTTSQARRRIKTGSGSCNCLRGLGTPCSKLEDPLLGPLYFFSASGPPGREGPEPSAVCGRRVQGFRLPAEPSS